MDARSEGRGRAPLLGPRIVAAALVLGGALLVQQALQIGQVRGYQVVGPTTLPLFVSLVLVLLGLVLAVRTTLKPDRDLEALVAEEERVTHWPAVGLMLSALVVYAFGLNGVRLGPLDVPGLGYVVATGLFLPVVARVLGSRQFLRDLVVGFGVALVVYLFFTEVLGVRLPAGILGLLD